LWNSRQDFAVFISVQFAAANKVLALPAREVSGRFFEKKLRKKLLSWVPGDV